MREKMHQRQETQDNTQHAGASQLSLYEQFARGSACHALDSATQKAVIIPCNLPCNSPIRYNLHGHLEEWLPMTIPEHWVKRVKYYRKLRTVSIQF